MAKPKDKKPSRFTQNQIAEMFGINPAIISRDWKPRFENHGWPGFYSDGVDSVEFLAGIRKWDKLTAKNSVRLEGDPKERLDDQRSEKLQLEIQRMRGDMIYVPDLVDEISRMQAEYVSAQNRIPRTVVANLLAYIATVIADDIAKNPAVADAFSKIDQGDLENWFARRFSEATGDMGKKLKQAWRNAIDRARIRFS